MHVRNIPPAQVEAGAKPVPAAQVRAELGIEAEPEIENAEIEGPEIEA
jgi:hypothetical protein